MPKDQTPQPQATSKTLPPAVLKPGSNSQLTGSLRSALAAARGQPGSGSEEGRIEDARWIIESADARRAAAAFGETTQIVRAGASPAAAEPKAIKTQLVRGKGKPERAKFAADPVVGWLVIVGGPGLGAYRPIYEGNNTVGRNASQRVPIDFGDDAISAEEQAYIRYDSTDRRFLFVPNLTKTNVVAVNNAKPTAAVELSAMDVITVGRTQLVFVPFCGPDFDWAELPGNEG